MLWSYWSLHFHVITPNSFSDYFFHVRISICADGTYAQAARSAENIDASEKNFDASILLISDYWTTISNIIYR